MNSQKMSALGLLGLSFFLITQPSCSAQPKPQPQPQKEKTTQKTATTTSRQITFKNEITKPMLAYSYLFIKYSPSRFTVTINGQQIEPGQEKTIKVTDNKIKAQYYFEFGSHRSGTRSAEYLIDENTNVASVTFSWKKKIRISIDGATPTLDEETKVG